MAHRCLKSAKLLVLRQLVFFLGQSYLIYCLRSKKTLLVQSSVGEYNTLFFESANTRKSRSLTVVIKKKIELKIFCYGNNDDCSHSKTAVFQGKSVINRCASCRFPTRYNLKFSADMPNKFGFFRKETSCGNFLLTMPIFERLDSTSSIE